MSAIYAIADLHGRFDLLCRAIDLVEADGGEEGGTFIVMGDFVDRGPQSRNIIDLLMAGPSRGKWQWIVLQGNHEDIMLQALRDPQRHLNWWIGNGGGSTLRSYGYESGNPLSPLKVPATHLAWLDRLPLVHVTDHHIFVHAGIPFDQPVSTTPKQVMQWMLFTGDVDHADAQMFPDAPHVSGKHLVHGHHQSETHPLLKPHRTNLDSFAWYSGRAAIGVFEGPGGPARILSAIGSPAR